VGHPRYGPPGRRDVAKRRHAWSSWGLPAFGLLETVGVDVLEGALAALAVTVCRDARMLKDRPRAGGTGRSLVWGEWRRPIGRLVSVSCMHCCTSTSDLSTWWSATALIGRRCFKVGFPLRCFQRLSRPDLATRLRGWRHDRPTRGLSIPVLSY
jgi:hypothetical protein